VPARGDQALPEGRALLREKCAIERRNYPPGQHGLSRTKLTNYGIQLREKQKAKNIYGVLETQFRRYFERAEREKGITGENLLKLLERRLDNVVFRLGMAASRREARQMVAHGHMQVNGPQGVGAVLHREGRGRGGAPGTSKMQERVADNLGAGRSAVPPWLDVDVNQKKGMVRGLPVREDIQIPVQEQLIVELFSK
jgi:small subunit ribosomal protein S4